MNLGHTHIHIYPYKHTHTYVYAWVCHVYIFKALWLDEITWQKDSNGKGEKKFKREAWELLSKSRKHTKVWYVDKDLD